MIGATKANYIKLGEKGSYERFCFDKGVIALGFHEVPHQQPFNPQTTYDTYQRLGRKAGTCTSFMNQVAEFYQADDETLWFTFADGRLYWCIGADDIELVSNDPSDSGPSRYRLTQNGWHSADINGLPLHIHELNGNLTKIAGYQGTICSLSDERLQYLLQRINSQELPQISRARKNRSAALESIIDMMRMLNPKDFELLVELVFAQSGWQRMSPSGGTQKTVDIELYLPSTYEYAFAQVKSETNQQQLEEYEAAINSREDSYMFYVYHTAKKALVANDYRTRLIDAARLAEMILNAGLFDWLLKRAR